MDTKDQEAVVSKSTADVTGALSSVAGEKRQKKRTKKPAKSPGDDAGKEDSTPLELSGNAGTKVKSPGKEAVVSPSKNEVTGTLVTTPRGGKSRKKHSKKLEDAGATAAKDESALEVSARAGARSKTPDAGAVASSSKADVSSGTSPVDGEEKRPTKPSKHRSATSDDATKDKPTTGQAAQFPGKPEDDKPRSSAGPGVVNPPVQPAPTTEVPVQAQAYAKEAENLADVPANEDKDYITTLLPMIGAVIMVIALLVAVVVGLLVIKRPDRGDPAMVSTTSGKFVGKKVSVDGLDVYRWLGIPYAESTAGKNRFRKPRPRTVKRRTIAHEPRPPCPQWVNRTVVGSEDCLHMNVWAPERTYGDGSTLVLASASYWFQRGSNNEPDWAELAAKAGVVVMSPNVRLGVLGFLHPREDASDKDFEMDVAKEDAKAAVKWAVDNAAAFSARPDGVVLVGHGSGAYMLTQAVKTLGISCSRAILEGPLPESVYPLNTGKLEPSRNLATSINCIDSQKNSTSLPCLVKAAVEALLANAAKLEFRFAPSLTQLDLLKEKLPGIPEVIAGVDINQVREFFDEYVRPLAVATGNASTLAALLDFTLAYFLGKGSFAYEKASKSVATIATEEHFMITLALLMGGCRTRALARNASAKGFHYIIDGAGKQLFEPILDMAAIVNFVKDGSVPSMKNGDPWKSWGSSNATRIELLNDTMAPTEEDISKTCEFK